MSWQAYVDTSLVGTQTVSKGAIFNKEGTSVWASSPGLTISPDEMKSIASYFASPSDQIFGTGFKIAGDKYVTIKAEDQSLYGKKGKEGLCICATKQAIIIAQYGETIQPGQAANTVEQLADYLRGVGY